MKKTFLTFILAMTLLLAACSNKTQDSTASKILELQKAFTALLTETATFTKEMQLSKQEDKTQDYEKFYTAHIQAVEQLISKIDAIDTSTLESEQLTCFEQLKTYVNDYLAYTKAAQKVLVQPAEKLTPNDFVTLETQLSKFTESKMQYQSCIDNDIFNRKSK